MQYFLTHWLRLYLMGFMRDRRHITTLGRKLCDVTQILYMGVVVHKNRMLCRSDDVTL